MPSSNDTIRKRVLEEIAWDDRIDGEDVEAAVTDGIVTLGGRVPTYLAREAAETDALLVPGVVNVVNGLEVRPPRSPAPPPDEEIRATAAAALGWNPDLDVKGLQVAVAAGRVSLTGYVDAYWRRRHAEDLVRNIRGVVAVENRLAVVPTAKVTDEAIAVDVVRSLDRRLGGDGGQIEVEVADGRVRLSGRVASRDAHRTACDAAAYTAGVTDLEEHLVIAP